MKPNWACNKELTKIVVSKDTEAQRVAFREIAIRTFDHFHQYEWGKRCEREEVVREAVDYAFTTITRFNPEKGKAIAFFTTCINGFCRQIMRSEKNNEA